MQYNTQPLVAALPAVVGAHPTRTAERLSELISQSQSMSVHHSMSVNISHPGAAIAERSGRNEKDYFCVEKLLGKRVCCSVDCYVRLSDCCATFKCGEAWTDFEHITRTRALSNAYVEVD